jgi:peptidoglycan hydrolase-like protein with peptidoglycan-binding domain
MVKASRPAARARRHLSLVPTRLPVVVLAVLCTAPIGTAAAASSGLPWAAPARAAPHDVCAYLIGNPTIRPGSDGLAVRQLQCYLNFALDPARYPPLPVDGHYGPSTFSRLRVFQGCVGIPFDGVVGPQTWAALRAAANSGSYLPC